MIELTIKSDKVCALSRVGLLSLPARALALLAPTGPMSVRGHPLYCVGIKGYNAARRTLSGKGVLPPM